MAAPAGGAGAAAPPGGAAAPPAAVCSPAAYDRRWRAFGLYGSHRRLEMLAERHAEEPLPEEERRRKSALAKREETALLAVRREIADIPKNGTFFMQNFVPGYERGKPIIEGLPCLPPCTHKFGSNAGEGQQASRFVAVPNQESPPIPP